ncbi:MAG: hypothetical protein ACI8W1_001581 [Candidatus Azotimanducaceae bacterium]|jgi:hypothetical protein
MICLVLDLKWDQINGLFKKLTKNVLALRATLHGTKYWKDKKLNDGISVRV